MTVIGIGGCMGLIVVGFGLQDSITAIAKNQFVNLFTYQASAVFNGDATEEKKAQVQSEMETYPGIQQILEMYCQSVELQSPKRSVDAVMEVPIMISRRRGLPSVRRRQIFWDSKSVIQCR